MNIELIEKTVSFAKTLRADSSQEDFEKFMDLKSQMSYDEFKAYLEKMGF